MSGSKKTKKAREKSLEETEEKSLSEKKADSASNITAKQIEKASKNLNYISETDSEILPFIGNTTETISAAEILSQTASAVDLPVEEKKFADFFARLTEIQDWFGDEEKETAQKFEQLREVLENNLRDLKVFKIGKVQLDIYVVGIDAENQLLGIKTKAVET